MKSDLGGWESFFEEGMKYHKTAQRSVRRPEVFTPAIIQNIAAMSIEKYFMAIFMHRGQLPRNHTMTDLLEEAHEFLSIRPDLEETLRYMDSLQRICSVDDIQVTAPKEEDVPRFIEAATLVSELAGKELGRDVSRF